MSSRVPPHSESAEKSVLGSMLASAEAVMSAIALLSGDSFYDPRHAKIWYAITAIALLSGDSFYDPRHAKIWYAITAICGRNAQVDLVTVAEELKRRNDFESVGGFSYLTSLDEHVTNARNVDAHAQIMLEKHALRRTIEAGREIIAAAYDQREEAQVIIENAWRRLGLGGLDGRPAPELKFHSWQELQALEVPPERWLIDQLIPLGGLTMLCGDWGTWKTWLLDAIGISYATTSPFLGRFGVLVEDGGQSPVLMFLLEGGEAEAKRRAVALDPGRRDLPIYTFAARSLSFTKPETRAMLERAVRKYKPALIMVDNQRIAFEGTEDDSENARDIRFFIDDMNAIHPSTWVVAHHENKWGTGPVRGKKVRGSGAHGGNQDSLLMLEAKSADEGVLHHEKARNGKKNVPIPFRWYGPESEGGARFEVLDDPVPPPLNDRPDQPLLGLLEKAPGGRLPRQFALTALTRFSYQQVDNAMDRFEKCGKAHRETVGRECVFVLNGEGELKL